MARHFGALAPRGNRLTVVYGGPHTLGRQLGNVSRAETLSYQRVSARCSSGGAMTRYMTDEGKFLKMAYQWRRANAQPPLTGPLEVSVTFYVGMKREADLDNFTSFGLTR
jgi:hypothetical protein